MGGEALVGSVKHTDCTVNPIYPQPSSKEMASHPSAVHVHYEFARTLSPGYRYFYAYSTGRKKDPKRVRHASSFAATSSER